MKEHLIDTSSQTRWLKLICAILLVFLIAEVLPILSLSFYAHTALDDFSFGQHNAVALRNHTSLLRSVLQTAKGYYGGWQGTFSAVALMSLVPSLFGEQFYFLTAFVMLGMLMFSTCKLSRTLAVRVLHAPAAAGWALSLTLLILSISLLPSPYEAFYWWNGAMFYTFFYGLMLLLLDQLLLMYLSVDQKAMAGHFVGAAALCVMVGGGNYVSALLAVELCALWLIPVFRKRKHLRIPAVILFIVLTACFACSVLAPGNAVRQATETGGYPPIEAILQAVLQAGEDFSAFFDPTICLFLLLGVLVFLRLMPEISFDFRRPLAVQLLAFLIYASQHTPHLYAIGTSGPGRMQNIFFFSHLWLLFFSVFYWTGYIAKRFSLNLRGRVLRVPALILSMLLICVATMQCIHHETAPAMALQTITDGSARAFDREMDRRTELYTDPAVQDVYLTPLQSKPEMLIEWDADPDSNSWINTAISNFYEKNSVLLLADTE